MRYIRVEHVLASIALVVVAACGGGTAATVGLTAPPAVVEPAETPGAGDPEAQLRSAFDESLAAAALDEPVDEPDCGDVVPRPNGVYCRYSAAADANHNVEAQLKDMTRAEFDALAETLQMAEELPNVAVAAYKLDRSLMGGTGAVVLAFAGNRGVTVVIQDDGDQAEMLEAAKNIALAALAYA
jgi:hypothetical protein